MDASSRNKAKTGKLHPLVGVLDELIAAVGAAGLPDTVALLRISRLDLAMRLHGIEAEELELLAAALTRKAKLLPPKTRSARAVGCRGGKMPQVRR